MTIVFVVLNECYKYGNTSFAHLIITKKIKLLLFQTKRRN